MNPKIFENLESEVRSYSRSFPVVFNRARGEWIYDENGKGYLDFLSGAGSLNYGHNNPLLKEKLIEYLQSDGISHSLDLYSSAKKDFLETFQRHILFPREMDYRVQFSGPTGTNAVEAAMKLARKVTGRTNIISFTNGFHGVTAGSVAATGNSFYREGTGQPLQNTSFMPFDGYLDGADTASYVRRFLEDSSSGVDAPAAFILETVQGEGGVNVASAEWLVEIAKTCRDFGALLIVDDIQVGCGRTGKFFSFEEAAITPDIVVLSKSLSGYGLPFSLVLMKPEYDLWTPGEHNGTFRGNNLAFVTAAETIRRYWASSPLTGEVERKSEIVKEAVDAIVEEHPRYVLQSRGRGLIWALDCKASEVASRISKKAFEKGLIIETCGSDSHVVKCLPSLLIADENLRHGLNVLAEAVRETFRELEEEKTEVLEEVLR